MSFLHVWLSSDTSFNVWFAWHQSDYRFLQFEYLPEKLHLSQCFCDLCGGVVTWLFSFSEFKLQLLSHILMCKIQLLLITRWKKFCNWTILFSTSCSVYTQMKVTSKPLRIEQCLINIQLLNCLKWWRIYFFCDMEICSYHSKFSFVESELNFVEVVAW